MCRSPRRRRRSPRISPAGAGGQDYIRPGKGRDFAGSVSRLVVPLKDKPSVSVILGQPTGLRYRDPDALALRVGTAVLGRGFTGRLMGIVRDQEGLTYDIEREVTEDSIADGAWDISASFAPALLDKGLASTRRVLDALVAGRRHRRRNSRPASRGSSAPIWSACRPRGGLASAILTTVQRGYDLELARRLSAGDPGADARSGQQGHPHAPRSEHHGAGRGGQRPAARRPSRPRNSAPAAH